MVRIETADAATDRLLSDLNDLLPQLRPDVPPLTLSGLTSLIRDPSTSLLIARDGDRAVGMTVLATYPVPTGSKAWIEDVVVDRAYRGAGIGASLVRHAVDLARKLGCETVDLTSRPSRVEANRMYERLGFEQRDTRVFRLRLDPAK